MITSECGLDRSHLNEVQKKILFDYNKKVSIPLTKNKGWKTEIFQIEYMENIESLIVHEVEYTK